MKDWAQRSAGLPDDDAESSPLYAPGQELAGRYTLIRKLAAGGMGEVWVAHHTKLDVNVAIKVVRAGFGGSAAAERLLVEARSAAKLDHPAIVRVFDVGNTENGMPFIVMELLSGEPLSALIEREEGVKAVRAVQLLLPISRGLSAAHGKGLIHRDIKPDNVFLARLDAGNLQPKILDFGIVKLKENHRKLTRDGIVLGSVDYVSPEQARGLPIDHRADVWSFCVSLYETIAGFRPFVGDTYRDQLHAIIQLPHAPLISYQLADAQLSAIVDRGLEKDLDRRWPSMEQLGAALAGWLARQGVTEDATGAALRASFPEAEDRPSPIRVASIERSHTPPAPARAEPAPQRRQPAPQRAGLDNTAPPSAYQPQSPDAAAPTAKLGSGLLLAVSVVVIAALAGGVTYLIVRSRANELATPASVTAAAALAPAEQPQHSAAHVAAPPPAPTVQPVTPSTAIPTPTTTTTPTPQSPVHRAGRSNTPPAAAQPPAAPAPLPPASAAAPPPPPPPPPKDDLKDPYGK